MKNLHLIRCVVEFSTTTFAGKPGFKNRNSICMVHSDYELLCCNTVIIIIILLPPPIPTPLLLVYRMFFITIITVCLSWGFQDLHHIIYYCCQRLCKKGRNMGGMHRIQHQLVSISFKNLKKEIAGLRKKIIIYL